MADNTYKNQGTNLEDIYLTWEEVGLPTPSEVEASGRLFAWGESGLHELGQGSTTDRSSPVSIGSNTDWKQVFAGAGFSLALKTDNTLWGWGYNDSGRLGDGSTATKSTPTLVNSDGDWLDISSNGSHVLAIKTDGTLWAWGENTYGKLGIGVLGSSRSTPTQVGSDTNWKQVSAGPSHSSAVKTDGTLWTWGNNNNGQLVQNDTADRSTPTQVGSDTNWSFVHASGRNTFAIKTNGELWGGGGNNAGEIGNNSTVTTSSLVQIGTDTDWKEVVGSTSSGSNSTIGLKTNGTIWSWGYNLYGTLGLNNTSAYSTPTQIGALTDWKTISVGLYNVAALKTDGTLWTWGYNTSGKLGQNISVATNRSSPVQVGSLATWKQVSCGNDHVLALQYDNPYQ